MSGGDSSTSRPATRFAPGGGVHIAYQTFGQGPPDVLVIPGWLSHVEMGWDNPGLAQIYNRLGSFGQVTIFDKRGTGLSDRNLGVTSLDERTADATAVMDAAGLDRAHVLGWSEGGPMALLMAATMPQRVESMVIYGAPPTWRAVDEVPGTAAAARFAAEMIQAIEFGWGTGEGLQWWVGPELATDGAKAAAGRAWTYMAGPNDALQLLRVLAEIDVREVLPLVGCPVLVIGATEDPVAPPEACRWMAEQLPNATYAEIPGPHFPFTSDSDLVRFLDLIEEFFTGAPPAARIERALATVMFTDLVGSTEAAVDLADARWRSLLDAHDRIAASTIARHGGRLIKSTGDGVLAVFDSPGQAIRSATQLRDELQTIGLTIRVGIHTGEIELRDNDDISGVAVNLAARIESQAAPSEVLVSRTVVDLTFGSKLTFEPRGAHALKGFPGEWELFAAHA